MPDLPPIKTDEKVYLHNTYFTDTKRRDGQVSAVLLIERRRGNRRVKDAVELVASDLGSLDTAVADWADHHAENLDELESLALEAPNA